MFAPWLWNYCFLSVSNIEVLYICVGIVSCKSRSATGLHKLLHIRGRLPGACMHAHMDKSLTCRGPVAPAHLPRPATELPELHRTSANPMAHIPVMCEAKTRD